MTRRETTWRRFRDQRGLTLVEVMVAAFVLILVFFALAQYYTRGRTHLNYEEDRRKATAVAQDRIDGIRRDYTYDDLITLDDTDTTYVVDDRTYDIHHEVWPGQPDPDIEATTIKLTIKWNAKVQGNDVERVHEVTTILGRGMPLP